MKKKNCPKRQTQSVHAYYVNLLCKIDNDSLYIMILFVSVLSNIVINTALFFLLCVKVIVS